MCGIVAIVDLEGRQNVVPLGVKMLESLQHRGHFGAGMAYIREGAIQVLKGEGNIREVLSEERLKHAGAKSSAVILQTRYPTNGSTDKRLLHPLSYEHKKIRRRFALAFNGNIPDYSDQESYLEAHDNPPQMKGDTEIMGRLLQTAMEEKNSSQMRKILPEALGGLDGAFNIVLLQGDGTISAVRDPHGFHSFSYGQQGSVVAFSSEDVAIRDVLPHARTQNIKEGSLLQARLGIKDLKPIEIWTPSTSVCFFRYIYFNDHRSRTDRTSVANARYEAGKILATMDMDRPKDDIAVPVPESAKIATNGYVDARGIRRVDAIVRNPDVGRTFIHDEEGRKAKAQLKYMIEPNLVKDKCIILLDDSLVRGVTTMELAERLRSAGATKIHLRLASPPIMAPCFYGMDFPTVKELLARKYSKEHALTTGDILPDDALAAMATDLKVDSIKYLPVSALPLVVGKDEEHICRACVTGQYPTINGQKLYEIENKNHQATSSL